MSATEAVGTEWPQGALTVSEVATKCAVTIDSVHVWMKAGLPHHRILIGGQERLLIDSTVVNELIPPLRERYGKGFCTALRVCRDLALASEGLPLD